ncbi:LrgB family protein [Oceanivirga salmonicida]|uniref:LrgB family protein n=1 Tax=Oceanivirga salmonicida TaxID=1769291 RepID=UPI00082E82D3|nr:LrgB family protein [Oceanivirga salmonicida]
MNNVVMNPFFGILLTLFIFKLSTKIVKRTNISLINPLLLTIIIIILILKVLKIDYNSYSMGGDILTSLIGPATVALAIPLYKNFHLLKKHYISILTGIIVGNSLNIVLIILFTKLFDYDKKIIISFLPKSITTAIAVGVSESLNGIIPITVVLVIITGISGSVIAPTLFKIFKIEDDIAMGVSLGASSHAIGTSRAIEISHTAGAMGGLSIVLTGIVVIIIAPLALLFI